MKSSKYSAHFRRIQAVAAMLLGLLVTVCLAYWLNLLSSQQALRTETLANAQKQAVSLASALGLQAESQTRGLDVVLQHLRNEYTQNPNPGHLDRQLSMMELPADQVAQVSVIGADGYLAYSNLPRHERIYLGDREHFQAFRHDPSDRLFISKPMLGRVSHVWSVQFARPLLHGGAFAGVVVLSVAAGHLALQLADLHLASERDVAGLVGRDGYYRARSSRIDEVMGRAVPASSPFLRADAAPHGTYRFVSKVDGVDRLYAWRRLERYPLIVLIGLETHGVLAPVEMATAAGTRRSALATAIVLMLGLGIVWLMLRLGRQQDRVLQNLQLLQSVFDAASEGIMVTNAENIIIAVNPAFTAITGYDAEEAVGRKPSLLSSGQHDLVFYTGLWQRLLSDGHWEGELKNRRKDGRLYAEWLKVSVLQDDGGSPYRFVALLSDITEQKLQEERVWRQANFDALTGLPNRKLLADRLQLALAQAQRKNTEVAVLFLDLNRFKPVNDQYGHSIGDELLCQVARRLERLLRAEDTVARVGGDEFVVVLPDLGSVDAVTATCGKIAAELARPFELGAHVVGISCSIGLALYPRDATDAAELLKLADMAMYSQKHGGRVAR
jgi:diguanylate cyclase (GGDEF)-like protein/PAS domain S-box-containing protein